jgi:hypothetical protein
MEPDELAILPWGPELLGLTGHFDSVIDPLVQRGDSEGEILKACISDVARLTHDVIARHAALVDALDDPEAEGGPEELWVEILSEVRELEQRYPTLPAYEPQGDEPPPADSAA